MSGHPIYKPAYNYQGTANNEAETTTFAERRPPAVRRRRDRRHRRRALRQRQPVQRRPRRVDQHRRPADQPGRERPPGRPGGLDRRRPGDAREHLRHRPRRRPGLRHRRRRRPRLRQQHQGPGQHRPRPTSSSTTSATPTSRSSRTASSPRPSTRSRPRASPTSAPPATAADHGYLSNFRGRERHGREPRQRACSMNFDGTGATQTCSCRSRSTSPTRSIVFQFDQPFNTQQPAGSTNVVTSQVNFYVLDAGRRRSSPRAPTTTSRPRSRSSSSTVPDTGSYHGRHPGRQGPEPRPRRVRPVRPAVGQRLIVSQQFGARGRHVLPDHVGHNTAAATRSASARSPGGPRAPTWARHPLGSEPFSSSGPSIIVRNPDGSLMTTAQTVQNPTITAPDGGNTSFFAGRRSTPATRRSRASRRRRPTCRRTCPASSARPRRPPTPRPSRP